VTKRTLRKPVQNDGMLLLDSDKLRSIEDLIEAADGILEKAEESRNWVQMSAAASDVRCLLEELLETIWPANIELQLDRARGVLRVNGAPVHLTALEFRILSHLVSAGKEATGKKDLTCLIYGSYEPNLERTLAVHVSKLRAKLRNATGRDDLIAFRVGHGWVLRDNMDLSNTDARPVRWMV
jgi:DNA-binding winged helix-turn-helix (wHTH) protein